MNKVTFAVVAGLILALTGCAQTESPAPVTHTIIYSVTSDTPSSLVTTYSQEKDGVWSSVQLGAVPLPWSHSIQVSESANDHKSISGFFVGAKGALGSSIITCKITVDGKTVSTQTVDGQHKVVSCPK